MFAEIAALGGALLPAIGSILGGESTNRSNEAIANNATAANMQDAENNRRWQEGRQLWATENNNDQARRQQDFQERMSSTAYQRASADMKSAGINPIYFQGANASSPSGSSAQSAGVSGAQGSAVSIPSKNAYEGLGSLASSAFEALQLTSRLENNQAQTNLLNAQAKESLTNAKVKEKDLPKSDLINRAYKLVEPALNKVEEMFKTTPKSIPMHKKP